MKLSSITFATAHSHAAREFTANAAQTAGHGAAKVINQLCSNLKLEIGPVAASYATRVQRIAAAFMETTSAATEPDATKQGSVPSATPTRPTGPGTTFNPQYNA